MPLRRIGMLLPPPLILTQLQGLDNAPVLQCVMHRVDTGHALRRVIFVIENLYICTSIQEFVHLGSPSKHEVRHPVSKIRENLSTPTPALGLPLIPLHCRPRALQGIFCQALKDDFRHSPRSENCWSLSGQHFIQHNTKGINIGGG